MATLKYWDGTQWQYVGPSVETGYRFKERVIFTASGTFTKANYSGIKAVYITCVGGGGAGAGSTTANSGGAGGGAGATAMSFLLESALAAGETVTVGSGGTGGTGSGGSGGDTSFGTHVIAKGGEGGGGLTSYHGGRGGSVANGASTGQLIYLGGDGQSVGDPTLYTTGGIYPAGTGGSSLLGGGGFGSAARAANASGGTGRAPGSGGGGGYNRNSNTSGGNGASGIVIVDVYI